MTQFVSDGVALGAIDFTRNQLRLIQSQVLTSPTATVTFSGLNGDADIMYLLTWKAKHTATSAAKLVNVQVNGVTTNQSSRSYNYEGTFASNTHALWRIGSIGNDGTPNGAGCGVTYIHAPTGEWRLMHSWGSATSTVGDIEYFNSNGVWKDTSTNITSLAVVFDDASNIDTGSRFDLYKVVPSAATGSSGAAATGTFVGVLSQTAGISATATGTTNLYTVPDGKRCVVTGATIRCTAATAITDAATLGIGVAAGEEDIIDSQKVLGVHAALDAYRLNPTGKMILPQSGEIIKLGIDTAATGTSQVLAVDLYGYLTS